MPNGKIAEKYIQLCFAPLLDAHNTISGIILTANDITALVHARKQVEENENYFRKMADNGAGYDFFVEKRWLLHLQKPQMV